VQFYWNLSIRADFSHSKHESPGDIDLFREKRRWSRGGGDQIKTMTFKKSKRKRIPSFEIPEKKIVLI